MGIKQFFKNAFSDMKESAMGRSEDEPQSPSRNDAKRTRRTNCRSKDKNRRRKRTHRKRKERQIKSTQTRRNRRVFPFSRR